MSTWLELADMAIVASRDVFGVAATFTPVSTGVAETLVAVHDSAHLELSFSEHIQSASRPMVDVRIDDLTVTPIQGDAVTVAGVGFVISDVQLDGHGAAKLFLVVAT